MRERVGQGKKATANSFSISTLKQPTRGFGLESSHVMPKETTEQQTVKKTLSQDLNRISMRPQAKLIENALVQRTLEDGSSGTGHVASKFKLAPGGIEAHEGHKILTSSSKGKEIHVLSKHGPSVAEAKLPARLEDMKELFKNKRDENIKNNEAKIKASQKRIDVAKGRKDKQKDTNKKADLESDIKKNETNIKKLEDEIREWEAIDENNRDAVFSALDKWKTPGMPTHQVTKFTDLGTMKTAINEALKNNQNNIDAAFIDKSNLPRQNGTSCKIEYKSSAGNLGIGYQFNEKMEVVPIKDPLNKMVIIVVISDASKYEYMVETAYLTP